MASRLGLVLALAACSVALRRCAGVEHHTDPLLRRALYLEPNAHLQQLSMISDTEGSLARTFFSPAHRRAAQQIEAWMRDCGMESWVDAVGNVHGRINATAPGGGAVLPAVLLGSHYDTVLDGGAYDGALGILVGLAAVKGMLLSEASRRGLLGGVALGPEGASNVIAGHTGISIDVRSKTDEVRERVVQRLLASIASVCARRGVGCDVDRKHDAAAVLSDPGVMEDMIAATKAAAPLFFSALEGAEARGSGGLVAAGLRSVPVLVSGAGHDAMAIAEVVGTLLRHRMLGSRDRSGSSLEEVLRAEGGLHDPAAAVAAAALEAGAVSEYVEVHIEQVRVVVVVVMVVVVVGPVLESRGLPLGVVAGIAGQTRLWVGVDGTQGHAGTVPMRGRRDSLAAAAELVLALEALCLTPESEGGAPAMCMLFVRCRGGVSHSPLEHVEHEDVAASAAALAEYLRARTAGGEHHDEL
ncbi:Allantoate deiminase, chloroplastic [Tetrabaena socialis]|uniref:Allantoate deiminase, chloroplastic n=1 Tax=Tetrabaena socialis TaxID=47790 RepID=A0A2J7ZSZ2_9CHLO|nr:Allantoate deiminase, chloroplastic [Tetrabaena socialis]|eukprot:PNH03393.1 Allantoate deiminase, chloroplastic [Tetrabaena socialis]